MGIGIGISVTGIDKLREAKKEVGLLSDGLREARDLGSIDIAPKGISDLLSEFKQIGTETRAAVSGIGDIASELRNLKGLGAFRFDMPDPASMRRFADSIREVHSLGRAVTLRQAPPRPRLPKNHQNQNHHLRNPRRRKRR